jgi:hypothetical protein
MAKQQLANRKGQPRECLASARATDPTRIGGDPVGTARAARRPLDSRAMSLRRANQELLRVRAWRNWGDPPWSIKAAVGEAHAAVERAAKSGSALEKAWREVLPASLLGRAASVSLTRGVLTVRASDASARWEVDRWLRGGGERELARAARVVIRRVKFVAG